MERKTTSAYVSVLQEFSRLCSARSITVESVITDYEQAIHAAIARVMPTTNCKRCYFHFARAVYQKYKSMGLTRDANNTRKIAIKKFMCLALLPNELVVEAIELIKGKYNFFMSTIYRIFNRLEYLDFDNLLV